MWAFHPNTAKKNTVALGAPSSARCPSGGELCRGRIRDPGGASRRVLASVGVSRIPAVALSSPLCVPSPRRCCTGPCPSDSPGLAAGAAGAPVKVGAPLSGVAGARPRVAAKCHAAPLDPGQMHGSESRPRGARSPARALAVELPSVALPAILRGRRCRTRPAWLGRPAPVLCRRRAQAGQRPRSRLPRGGAPALDAAAVTVSRLVLGVGAGVVAALRRAGAPGHVAPGVLQRRLLLQAPAQAQR